MTHGDENAFRMAELTTGGGLRALEELRSAGAIAGFGMGVNEIAACLEVMDHARLDVILLAGRYTLLEQNALDVLFPRCDDGGHGHRGGRALQFRHPGAGHEDRLRRFIITTNPRPPMSSTRCAASRRCAMPMACRWRRRRCNSRWRIRWWPASFPGLDSPERVEQTVALYRHKIPAALWQDLKREKLLREDAPVP